MKTPPFYVGQRVVAVFNCVDEKGKIFFSKGQEFIIHGLTKCCMHRVDVGIRINSTYYCECGFKSKEILWLGSGFFAPITENFEQISYEKVMEEENKLISVN